MSTRKYSLTECYQMGYSDGLKHWDYIPMEGWGFEQKEMYRQGFEDARSPALIY